MTTEEKILACYTHVKPKSIAKMLGVKYNHVYHVLFIKHNFVSETKYPNMKMPKFIYNRQLCYNQ
jgi:hypothetical protein